MKFVGGRTTCTKVPERFSQIQNITHRLTQSLTLTQSSTKTPSSTVRLLIAENSRKTSFSSTTRNIRSAFDHPKRWYTGRAGTWKWLTIQGFIHTPNRTFRQGWRKIWKCTDLNISAQQNNMTNDWARIHRLNTKRTKTFMRKHLESCLHYTPQRM